MTTADYAREATTTADRVLAMARTWRIPSRIGDDPVLTYACSVCGGGVARFVMVGGELRCGRCA